ncbi:hypothetical protein HMPREF0063_12867 [Aeromicrobium marinum DSM 15272]|uniref:GmrSD restriction endonucleases N-terminal domain-containing protein n=1 Tax=Aeromicrobium marinum DSM 15272 TaxID=585531 RepID=E2SFQ8_9ACTN|nr:DUF262 domain-containing protein [Aeromicrobium marinum]EFQ82025.1 hypothetical protein HMPREF0063_12867 [Aeromicrobium marinum DSM 15272]
MKLSKSELELESVYNRINKGEIDLQPDFQRGEIWDNRRRQRLVDTIIRNWYVPAVHVVKDRDGNEEVLDGQQRLAAIRDFFEDRFGIDGRIEPHNDEILGLHGAKFSHLPEARRRSIQRFTLQIITLTDFEPQEPNELFFRLNQSYNLTPPEKRNALHGEARDAVKELVARLKEVGLLSPESVGFSNGRLAYDDIVARTCVALETDDLGVHINNNVVEDFYRNKEFTERTLERVESAGRALQVQVQRCPERVRFNKGTLFTWLVFLDWASGVYGGVPLELLSRFEADRRRSKNGADPGMSEDRRLLELVSLYEDRAAYRVTDVSSVRTRDLALHLYSNYIFDTPSVRNSDAVLRRITEPSLEPVSSVISDFLAEETWGSELHELAEQT